LNTRQSTLDHISEIPEITVLIIGGGINGAGLFRELALQGIDVLLVDKSDFCSGASAAPSRLIHGGLRYLEHGEFRLVRESLLERNLLLQNAPHYVFPLPTTIPIFSWLAGIPGAIKKFLGWGDSPSNRGALIIKMGLSLYDFYARKSQMMPRHNFSSHRTAMARRPLLNQNIVCTATYYDAWISYPERLCLELLLDASAAHDRAYALNYVACVAQDEGKNTVLLQDELNGQTLSVKPKIVVNATGAWIDFTNRFLKQETTFIGGTKGSHLVIDNDELFAATAGHMLYYENPDGRICILFPWHNRVLVGSTDIRINNPDEAVCDESEIEYMLQSVGQVFPKIELKRSDIVAHFCGVRPLPANNASTTGQISRDHQCTIINPDEKNSFPIYSLIGGKWTTFRAFSQQVADQLLLVLDQTRQVDSTNLAIGGGKDFPQTVEEQEVWLTRLAAQTSLSQEQLRALSGRYGSRAEQIAEFMVEAGDAPLKHDASYSRREIEFIVSQEQVFHLDDLVLRRTDLALLGRLNSDLLAELATITAAVRHWTESQKQEEITKTTALLQTKFGVQL
jgi:glycerol-3-phosphate dehydrogenase